MFVRNSVAEFLSKVTAESVACHDIATYSVETLDPISVHAMNKAPWRCVNQRPLQNLA